MASDKRIFLITGCSSGLGYETSYAIANASSNYHVLFTARSSSKGKPAFEEIKARKPAGDISWLQLDVTSDDSIAAAVKHVEENFGKLDVLINNAAITEPGRLADTERPIYTRETLARVFDTNAIGPFMLVQAMEHLLKKSSDPRIVDISTTLGSVQIKSEHDNPIGNVRWDAYRASKAAMNMISQCHRYNFRDWAKVHTMSPGLVISNLSGPEDVEFRRENGGLEASYSAGLVLGIVEGKNDHQLGKLLDHEGGTDPW